MPALAQALLLCSIPPLAGQDQLRETKRVLILIKGDPGSPTYRAAEENRPATVCVGSPSRILNLTMPMDRVHCVQHSLSPAQVGWKEWSHLGSWLGGVSSEMLFPNKPSLHQATHSRKALLVSLVGRGSIGLFVSVNQAAIGLPFLLTQEVFRIPAVSRTPVDVILTKPIGRGALGNYVTRFKETGKQVHTIGIELLARDHSNDSEAWNGYLFDGLPLGLWETPDSVLPVWKSYKYYALAIVLFAIAEALLIFNSLRRNGRRKFYRPLLRRTAFARILSDLSTSFINLPENKVPATITQSLNRIASYLGMERITIHEFSNKESELRPSVSWRSDERLPAPEVMNVSKFPWWANELLNGRRVLVSDLNSLPDQALAERKFLETIHAVSIASIPLKVGEQFLGCISFITTSRRVVWRNRLVEQLDRLAQLFSNVVMRRQAQEVRMRLAAIVESSNDAIISKDLDGIILSWNTAAERLFGYSETEAIGQPITILIPHELAEEEISIMRRLKTGFKIDHYETIRIRKDGTRINVSLAVSPITDSAARMIGISKIVRDITDRKQAEKELRQLSAHLLQVQDEERRKMARDLHDTTGQNLVALETNLGLLKEATPPSDEKFREALLQCQQLAEQCLREIRTLSYLLHPPMLEEAGLPDAIRQFMLGFMKRTGIQTNLEVTPEFGRMNRDVELTLFKVVQESLTNIHKHSGSSTSQILLVRRAGQVILEVRDAGRGLPRENFTNPGGTVFPAGVGISSMRERISLIGGRLEIVSTHSGTTVRVQVDENTEGCESSRSATA